MPSQRRIPTVLSLLAMLGFAGALVSIWLVESLPLATVLFGALAALFWALRDVLLPEGGLRWPRLRLFGRERGLDEILLVVGPPLLIVLLAFFRMWPASIGDPLVRNDHSIHVLKALVMGDHLLPRGEIAGWSQHMHAGYPAGELYPPAGEIWVSIVDLLTFKTLSAPAVYALAFTGFFAFCGLTMYAFGKHFGGRWVGLLAAVFLLFDPGEFRQAGWHYVVIYGVWAQSFGLAWFLLAFVRFDKLLTERRLRDVLLFGLYAGLSILGHPMGLLTMAVVLPLHVLFWWLRTHGRLRDIAGPLFLGLGLFALLAAVWLLPFVARKGLTTSIGVVWDGMEQLGLRFLTGDLFGGTPAFLSALGVVGMILCLRERRAIAATSVLAAVLFVFLSTSTVVLDFDLLTLSDSFRKIQYERFITQAKPFWFVLAAYALVTALRAGRERLRSADREGRPRGGWRRVVYAFLLGALVLGVSRPALDAAGRDYFGHHPRTARTFGPWHDYSAAADWLRAQAPDEWWRLAVADGEHAHELYLLAGMVERPTVKIGYTPAENYRFAPNKRSDYDLLRKIGVRYFVSRDKRRHRLLGEPKHFGPLWVHPIKNPVLAPWDITGDGKVSLETFEDEHIALRLAGTAAGDRLKVLVGYHPRWEATLNGEPVAIRERPYKGVEHSLHVMEIEAADGLLELRYVSRDVDRLATASGLAFLFLFALLSFASGVPALRRRLWTPLSDWYAANRGRVGSLLLGLAVGVALAVGVLFVLVKAGRGGERVLFRASDEVSHAQVWYRSTTSGSDMACRDWGAGRWTCNREETNWRFVGPVAVSFADVPTRCVWAHPIDGRALEISYPDVPLGAAVDGFVALEDRAVRKKGRKGAEVTMEVLLDGKSLGKVKRRNVEGTKDFRFDLPAGRERGTLTFRVTSPSEHWRNFCFEAKVVERREENPGGPESQ